MYKALDVARYIVNKCIERENKMFNSKMYKKYYPVKSSADIVNMNTADKKKLIKWIKSIIADVDVYNAQSRKRAATAGCKECWRINFYPDKEYIDSVCQKITSQPFSLTAEDIQLVNIVLYRHKYKGIISAYCFPVLPTTE